ncbi:hypothetical protein [Nakamurella endophytica]|uniref:hypothetical protein n=1 Tax=Nakamurella endophytica TaxID=1748367 RepID=UPI001E57B375|nr:hypothetical protein [Nakamurella endophytica]
MPSPPGPPEAVRRAAHELGRTLLVRGAVLAAVAVLLVVAAVLAYRHGVRDDTFPPYVAGTTGTTITRYSGPWIAGAGGALLVAGLLAVGAARDLLGWRRMVRASR